MKTRYLLFFVVLLMLACAGFFWFVRQHKQGQWSDPKVKVAAEVTAQNLSSDNSKIVYLTFDADMTPAMKQSLASHKVKIWYDPELVQYLRSKHIPATIFSTGMFAEIYPQLVKDLAADKIFAFGNHSYDHAAFEQPCYGLSMLLNDDQKKLEISKTQEILAGLTGTAPKYFRYPGLCANTHDNELVRSFGLAIASENVVSGDAFSNNSDLVTARVLKKIHYLKGAPAVVVMHLGGPNAPGTFAAVQKIVPQLSKEGFTFQALR